MIGCVAHRSIPSPTEWVITDFTVRAIDTLIRISTINAITGLRVAQLFRATDHAITRFNRTVAQ